MDPVCHSLVGATLAQTGLKRQTRFGAIALILAANAPDVDVLAAVVGRNLEWRRGWTHGVLAIALWPWVIAGLFAAWDRLRPARGDAVRFDFRRVALIAAIGVVTHPFLDFMNNYGMRWLMPFRNRWYYGDTLFIVDPWLLLLLGLGIWFSLRRERVDRADWFGPARLTLALASIYLGGMMGSTLVARQVVGRELAGAGPVRLMVTAVPIDPLSKQVIAEVGSSYRVGTFRFGEAVRWRNEVARGPFDDPRVSRAAAAPRARGFVGWARFPVVRLMPKGDSTTVRFYDLRYSDGRGESWAGFEITVPDTGGESRPGAR